MLQIDISARATQVGVDLTYGKLDTLVGVEKRRLPPRPAAELVANRYVHLSGTDDLG